MNGSGIGVTLFGLFFGVVVFLALREVWCWYWKVNAMLEELQGIRGLLKEMNDREVRRAQAVGPQARPSPEQWGEVR